MVRLQFYFRLLLDLYIVHANYERKNVNYERKNVNYEQKNVNYERKNVNYEQKNIFYKCTLIVWTVAEAPSCFYIFFFVVLKQQELLFKKWKHFNNNYKFDLLSISHEITNLISKETSLAGKKYFWTNFLGRNK